jgi:hypothetical protein
VDGHEPHVPGELAEHLLRVRFGTVDRKGLFSRGASVAADEIDRLEGGVVYLSVQGTH